MVWVFLYSLIFGGGHTTVFLTPDLKKNVKTYVESKEIQKEIFVLMKAAKKKQKEFVKTRKGYQKKSRKLNLDRNTTMETYLGLIDEYVEVRSDIQAYSIETEMAIKRKTSALEWENIMKSVVEKDTKNKLRKKMDKGSKKLFSKLKKVLNKHIKDKNNRSKSIEIVNSFEEEVNAAIPYLSELNYKTLENISSYDATLEEYMAVGNDIKEQRLKIVNSFLETRFALIKLTTVREWVKVSKALDKFIKEDMFS